MAILMQGSWTVSVKSKKAAFPQRFVIEGAASGNGTHAGDPASASVFVSGASWTIRVQHDPGSGWRNSDEQITTPSHTGSQYHFDIQSNDSGADQDFDDLVLTCAMPATATDFLVFGHVSSYRGFCLFNPCFLGSIVIETPAALAEALKYPSLREVLKKLYPERLRPQPPNPPDPSPFRPLVVSLEEKTAIPLKRELSLGLKRESAASSDTSKRAAQAVRTLVSSQSRVLSRTELAAAAVSFDRVGVRALADRFRLTCQTEALAGTVLRFQEYDRTASELSGGPYTGDGSRENLGVAVTDRNGNYIFRFSRSVADLFDEAGTDTATGEDLVVQSAPDLIVQLLDFGAPGSVLWETAPYFNTPTFRRINLCIPEGKLHPTRCVAGQVIQAIGNVFVGAAPAGPPPAGEPPGYGARVGFNNFLGLEGRVTAKNVLGPQTRCAAWTGTLDLFGCFLDHPQVTRYTLRYRELSSGAWTFFSQELLHPLIAKVAVPGYSGELIGPSLVNLHVDGGPATPTPSYLNIESNAAFVSTHRDRRAKIQTGLLSVAMPGPVQIWIEGYDASGNKVAGAEDSVTLYVDNVAPFVDIDDAVTMGSATLGNCAKFKLPAGELGAALTVKFKVDQAQGFLESYELFMFKGAIGSFAIAPPPPAGAPFRTRSYVHGDDLACSQLRGTLDDPTHDLGTGYVTIDLSPASGHWLEGTETFCAFSLNLSATTRKTDGYSAGYCCYTAIPVLIGIEA